ncbi:MAG: FHA domain-containing protein [Myxococcaceae bacterium]|nr:FHA domain-containing protein [Myxococcaceae bacterium]
MKSYLLSALRRVAAEGQEAFTRQHAGDWLVWEAGNWKAPRAQTLVLETVKGAGATPAAVTAHAPKAEALVIALPDKAQVTVGRAPDADVSLNDGTLSGNHLTLTRSRDGRWAIEDLGSTNGTSVEGLTLRVGDRMPLRNGSAIKAGQVTLTFQTSEGLWKRLSS